MLQFTKRYIFYPECFQQYGLLFLLEICSVKCCVLNFGKPFIVSKCYLLGDRNKVGGTGGRGVLKKLLFISISLFNINKTQDK